MIRENQQLFNRLNVVTDGILIYLMLPLSYWLRFYVIRGGIVTVPLPDYLRVGAVFTLVQLFTYAAFRLYQTTRNMRIRTELKHLLKASLLDALLLLGWLFVGGGSYYSRLALAIFFLLSVGAVGLKRVLIRKLLRRARAQGRNLKTVLVLGGGDSARRCLKELMQDRELGYRAVGYLARRETGEMPAPYLGSMEKLPSLLEKLGPDEVISAIPPEEYADTPGIIEACEEAGVKLAIVPLYAEYMPARPQFDDLNGIPMLNIRRIPLENNANAILKRLGDVLLSALGIVLLSPTLLVCAVGVKLSSPGPVIFRQKRVGKDKKVFTMYKFRSMRMNDTQDSAWSRKTDDRRTAFGSILRKYSLDELPQLFNVLLGDMSLVGPRPEIPHFVDEFRGTVPLYMVRHQVRPGITGWAQINGLRGDTPIKTRIEYDIDYIENWTPLFDLRILLATVFRGKFKNDEQVK
jgi:Undecaprenyl-phosphate glucose phosphotransferase